MSIRSESLQCIESVTSFDRLALHHGGVIEAPRLAWRLYGAPESPVVVALGGISAHRRTCAPGTEAPGWWQGMVGEGCALDTLRCRVLSFDYLGGFGESTAPTLDAPLPAISPFDQAELLQRLLRTLEIPQLCAIVGASYGGMVALAFGQRFPESVARLGVISAADRTHPMATAWRSVQRNMVRLALRRGAGADGMQLARALAMSTYRTPAEFAARFSGAPRFESGQVRFPVEDYLLARGERYAEQYSAASFLCLSESIDLHQVEPAQIAVPVRALGVREDQLVPIEDMRVMCQALPHAELQEISSLYGHDAFLKETTSLHAWMQPLLGESA
jgi:homoserine O-acetyltransferase